jgi:hypothetical protein
MPQVVTNDKEPIMISKRDPSCKIDVVKEKIKFLEQTLTLGLLDALFSYLNVEKKKSQEAVEALACHWRRIGLNVTLKAHL